MSTSDKLLTIVENEARAKELNQQLEDCLYGADVGGKSWYDEFWDNYQESGKKLNYNYAFAGASWNAEIFKPKYPLSGMSYANYMFAGAHRLIDIPYTIDLTSLVGVASMVFQGSTALSSIKEIIVNENNTYGGCFNNTNALKEIRFSGTIGQNGLDFHWSTKLSADSLRSIINALSSDTFGLTITLPMTSEANYEAVYGSGSWGALTATKNNWTIVYA